MKLLVFFSATCVSQVAPNASMGCAASTNKAAAPASPTKSVVPGEETMLRADGTVRTLSPEAKKAQELKAQESATRLAAMMKELGMDQPKDEPAYVARSDKALIAALQRQWYGTTLEMSAELFTPYLQATLCVAAADGLASDEARWLRARTLLLGLTPEQSAELLEFDTRANSIEPILEKVKGVKPAGAGGGGAARPLQDAVQRLLFYDGLTMAAQDGFSLDERMRAGRAAELLGLADEVVERLKAVVAAEEQLQQRKAALFADAEARAGRRQSRADGQKRAAMQSLAYGAELPLDADLEVQYVATLLAVAGADGLSVEEEGWVRDRAAVLGLPAQDVTPSNSFKKGADKVAALSEEEGVRGSAVAKAMLFDALLLAAQDGLSHAETERSDKLASQLALAADTVKEVRAIVGEETGLQAKKRELFGAPSPEA